MALFTPKLLNGPFGDAALLLESATVKNAVLFDLGDLHTLGTKALCKISHIFITHTHMDHFSGFETLLRQNLSRPTPLYLYGPPNFIKQVKAKLQGFTWNLVKDSCYMLELVVTEVRPRQTLTQTFKSKNAFKPQSPPLKRPFNGLLWQTEAFKVESVILDHGTPCLAFCFTEKARYNINALALAKLKLQNGPWLNRFKTALAQNANNNAGITAQTTTGEKVFMLGELKAALANVTPPYKLAYVTDLAYSKANLSKVQRLAQNVDMLYIEAAFTEADARHAREKHHLTTTQAANIIKSLKPRQWQIFHFSHKYQKCEKMLWQEVETRLA